MVNKLNYEYICIEGNIGAGKTSLCRLLASEFNGKSILEQFADNPFLPFFYKDSDRYAFSVELFFMTERHKQLQGTLLNRDLFYDCTISDYYFIKTLLFSKANLSDEEYRLFQTLFNILNKPFPQPDLLVYLHRPVGQLLENIKNRGRDYEVGISAEYLTKIQNTYFEYFRSITHFPLLIIDVESLDFVKRNRDYHEIKNLILRPYSPGIHHIRLM